MHQVETLKKVYKLYPLFNGQTLEILKRCHLNTYLKSECRPEMQVNPCTCVATPSTCVRGAGCPGSMEVAPPCSDLGTCWLNIAVLILDLGGSPRLMSFKIIYNIIINLKKKK
jgi:hypothetical protein